MTWRDRTAVAILLLVAQIICPQHAAEIRALANHVSVTGREVEKLPEPDAPRENGATT